MREQFQGSPFNTMNTLSTKYYTHFIIGIGMVTSSNGLRNRFVISMSFYCHHRLCSDFLYINHPLHAHHYIVWCR